jgi:hypothetical protein
MGFAASRTPPRTKVSAPQREPWRTRIPSPENWKVGGSTPASGHHRGPAQTLVLLVSLIMVRESVIRHISADQGSVTLKDWPRQNDQTVRSVRISQHQRARLDTGRVRAEPVGEDRRWLHLWLRSLVVGDGRG